METLLSRLDLCQPFVCYYAAHIGKIKRPMLPELVQSSGMSERTFMRIAHQTTWADVTMLRASQFAAACGIDVLDPKPVMEWLAGRIASGKLAEDFGVCRGQGTKMVVRFNMLAAKAVMGQGKGTK